MTCIPWSWVPGAGESLDTSARKRVNPLESSTPHPLHAERLSSLLLGFRISSKFFVFMLVFVFVLSL